MAHAGQLSVNRTPPRLTRSARICLLGESIDTENVGKTWGFSERRRVSASEGGRKRQLISEQFQLLIRWSGVRISHRLPETQGVGIHAAPFSFFNVASFVAIGPMLAAALPSRVTASLAGQGRSGTASAGDCNAAGIAGDMISFG